MLGVCKWFDKKKGYGFLSRDDGKEDAFVHWTALKNTRSLEEGQKVQFELREGPKGKIQAVTVEVCK
jgi:CspA family cold shock protein